MITQGKGMEGHHYLWGADGFLPGKGNVGIHPNDKPLNGRECHFAATCGSKVCSGRHYHDETLALPHGDPKNQQHLNNANQYAWFRMIRFKNLNPLWCEYCLDKYHFDCSGFASWLLEKECPATFQGRQSIESIRKKCDVIQEGGVSRHKLAIADILVRDGDGHIAFAVGNQSGLIVHAEWESTGVVVNNVGVKWEWHLRLPKKIWLRG